MIKEVIVVEGKNDIHAVKRAVDADCISTGGFGLSAHSLEKIEHAYKKRGIIILTDPDSAGERIRKFLSQRFPEAKHAFVPKEDAMAKNDIGIEQASGEAIRAALSKVRYLEWQPSEEFVWADIMNWGLSGAKDASARRAILGAKLGIGYANAKTFLQRLNHYGVTRNEFEQAVELNLEAYDETADYSK
ncbi:ribonuclease M5 [Pelosinus sp. UFO1]|uniref:ribonuclease M5 n=1 Tax=Pelosinus sp. UFO1 TaxID=484770 RepID=UPI0004D13107|nr:ribonuclease M5 [Pelosinus sp. UFO1]AIF53860.1 Primase-related protein [Pelosinus sp. UFO1]